VHFLKNDIENIDLWADRVISDWRNKNISLQQGASLEIINNTEIILGFRFPIAFKVLYQKANGFKDSDWNENMISFWPLNMIVENFGRYPDFIGFSDFLINSHVYGFTKQQEGVFKHYDIANPGIPEKIAVTFEEAIDLININSDILY
jgi:hypothetical protein